jgi:hypothetical protein
MGFISVWEPDTIHSPPRMCGLARSRKGIGEALLDALGREWPSHGALKMLAREFRSRCVLSVPGLE